MGGRAGSSAEQNWRHNSLELRLAAPWASPPASQDRDRAKSNSGLAGPPPSSCSAPPGVPVGGMRAVHAAAKTNARRLVPQTY